MRPGIPAAEPNPRAVLDAVAEARAAGIPWEQLAGTVIPPRRALQVTDPAQLAEARRFMSWRSKFPEAEDPETVERGARMLRAGPAAPLTEKVLGLPEGSTDFSDVARGLDDWAEHIYRRP